MISHVYRGIVVEQRGLAHLVPHLRQRHGTERDAHQAIDRFLDARSEPATDERAA